MVKQEWQLFLLALQFLTRLPVPGPVPYSDDLSIRSAKYYPMVGAVIAILGGAVLLLAAQVFPPAVSVILSLATTLLATGAFHEDGLADAADGLWGGATAERALEIMRDSRVGTYGLVTLGVVLSLKVSLLMAVSPWQAVLLLLGGHVFGRMACVHVIASTQYARDAGSKFVAPRVTPDGYRVALATTLVVLVGIVLQLGPVAAGSAAVICVAMGQGFRLIFLRKIGGYTGDCLGATQQMAEIGFYLGAVLWL